MAELKLLGAVSGVSPYVIRAQMALAVKGLAHDYLPEDLTRKSQLLLDSNRVHKTVPVLIHNGGPVCDSLVIVEYVDEAFPGAGAALLPADPYDRAVVARFWAAFIDSKAAAKTPEEEKAAKVKETLEALQLVEGAFGECSKGKPFFGGDAVGYLDIALGCYLCWIEGVSDIAGVAPPLLDAARTPELAALAARFRAADAVGCLVPGVDKVEAYLNNVLKPKWKAAAASSH